MTTLHFLDRLYRFNASYVERPALALIARQQVLRWLFDRTAQIGAYGPKGTVTTKMEDGSLWIKPPDVSEDAPYLLYIHGGGFTIGSPGTHRAMVAHIASAAGMRAHVPRYPLAPEQPFPAASDFLLERYKELLRDHGTPAAIAGDSAGGNLTLVTLMQARDDGLPLPRAMGLIAPIGDATGSIKDRFARAPSEYLIPPAWPARLTKVYLRGQDAADPRASPLLGDLSGLPPALLQVAKGEALEEDADRLLNALPSAEISRWDGLQHVWHLKAGSGPAANRACAEMGQFLGATARA